MVEFRYLKTILSLAFILHLINSSLSQQTNRHQSNQYLTTTTQQSVFLTNHNQATALNNQTSRNSQRPKFVQTQPTFDDQQTTTITLNPSQLSTFQSSNILSNDRQNPLATKPKIRNRRTSDTCNDRLCYGLPMGCLGGSSGRIGDSQQDASQSLSTSGSLCSVLVTSKRLIDPYKVTSRDIMFELIALPNPGQSNYAAVGFSDTGRMQGFVSECVQYRDSKTHLQVIKLRYSYNIPGAYTNVPVTILSGIRHLGVSFENGYYQCRWIVETSVEFTYEALNGTIISQREDLGYKNYHILLASGRYDETTDTKDIHTDRTSSMSPVSLAQTGHIKSLGAHILIRIHGSLMVAIWIGLVTLSIIMARYYKNEWSSTKLNDVAVWFVTHRTLMLISWFGSIIAVIFAYMYTESYHPGVHQISGTSCLLLSTLQIIGGLFRPSLESSRRVYFNWIHFVCGNLSYSLAMLCLVTAAFLAPAHLPPIYIWIIVAFVATYVLLHLMMTIHQFIIHRSSSTGFIAESYHKESRSPFRQMMLGIFVTILVIYIMLLVSLVNLK